MKSFPTISIQSLSSIFQNVVDLYSNDLDKILESARNVTQTDPNPFTFNPGGQIDAQIGEVKQRVKRGTNNYGRNLLIKIIEELNQDLYTNGGAIGVTQVDLVSTFEHSSLFGYKLLFKENNSWKFKWDVQLHEYPDQIELTVRDKSISSDDIIPPYVLQYVIQSLSSFNQKSYLTSLALISIALEGTLRDALSEKGYTYIFGRPENDTYGIIDMDVSLNPGGNGYLVNFNGDTESSAVSYVAADGVATSETVRVKRVLRAGRWFLEIRDVDNLKEYWSSNHVTQAGSVNIGGLGKALKVARYDEGILDGATLPSDTDEIIQKVRNNLIHLSGDALTAAISDTNNETLETFVSSQIKVYDVISSICNTIEGLYTKIADGTL